ncbi:YadA C-terminal domain-containing protein [Prochlorococcus marinus]|uniref:Trimeric autotransporter adhesin YadA-like C-terminal membrane anchor domain-containing protein n=1 Tax=Prochlorococcus marinus str. PAC1 TaxID=59924 RepID=A0A0A2C0Z4_PROMR|nr:YadA C-terminal domain-containing protein [Prochlorococcus marinus]KGG19988.1 hypothetical protein EV03_1452 [Prochlorococcus marinus str. PAC1]
MRRFASSALASAILLLGGTSVKAEEWDFWAVDYSGDSSIGNIVYTCVSATGSCTQRTTKVFNGNGWQTGSSYVDEDNNLVIYGSGGILHTYDLVNDTWTDSTDQFGNFQKIFQRGSIKKTSDGGVKIEVDETKLIERKSNGELHLGENSWITKEENGRQKVYAKDAAGNPIPIDYTNGTKLLINGRDVDQAIDNVGALSAALTGLPTVPQDSPLSCGVGAGAHSGSNALSGGCASKINERLTFNAAASFIPANQEYQGTDNSWSGRAGFVFKLGKINNPTLISMKEKKGMQAKITELSASNTEIKDANEKIQSQNKELKAKVDSFELEKAALVARLEKIEQIALANHKDEKTAFSFLNVSNLFSSMRSFLISSN